MTSLKQQVTRAITAAGIAFLGALPGNAAGLLAFEEVGGDVVAELSGSLVLGEPDRDGAGRSGPFLNPALLITTADLTISGSSGYFGTGPSSFGVDRGNSAGVASDGITPLSVELGGDGSALLSISNEYRSGSELSGTITWTGETLETLGLTPGEYVFVLGGLLPDQDRSAFAVSNEPEANETFTVRVGNAEVIPLPAAGLLLIGGLGALAMVRRRRKS